MTPRQKQLLVLLYGGKKELGLGDLIDADLMALIDLGYVEKDLQMAWIVAAGEKALIEAQA